MRARRQGIGYQSVLTSAAESDPPFATADGHNVYQAGYARMAGNNWTIGRRTDLQSGGESPESATMVEGKTLKASDFVTRVGRRKDLKSDGESSTASAKAGRKIERSSDS